MRTDRGAAPAPQRPRQPLRPQQLPACPLAGLAELLGIPAPAGAGSGDGAGSPPGAVSGVTHASAEVCPGDLFAALPGAYRHGAEFVAGAAAAGAAGVLTDPAGEAAAAAAGLPALVVDDPRARLGEVAARVYGDPSARLRIIGITGTAGKTTVAHLAAAGLAAAGRTPGVLGTVGTRLGDLVLDSVRTTPEATDLQALLAVAVEHGVDTVAMEVSSHALALGRVDGVRYEVGVFTNFGVDHLDFHRDRAGYFAAKARLFDGRCRVEVLNADDPALEGLVRRAGNNETDGTVTCSAAGDPAASWHARDVVPGAVDGYGPRFTAVGPGVVVPAGVGLPGRHNVSNALLALAALAAVGVDPARAAAGVAGAAGVPGRLERVGGSGPVLGVVDYAHKPDAIVAALAALREVAARRRGRLICVLGAGGQRDRAKRPLMGAAAVAGADLVVVTDDNPRSEDPATIRAEVLAGADGAGRPRIREVAGRRAAIGAAVAAAAPGDVVAVLGKGHERGQEVAGGTVHPFDDRTELATALAAAAAGAAPPDAPAAAPAEGPSR